MKYLLKGAQVVNEGKVEVQDILINGHIIEKIGTGLSSDGNTREMNLEGLTIFPGIIDDQVHFREPGLTHKGEIYTEAKAAVAGGTTSYMEMPNVNPQTLTQELLADKYARGKEKSLANYSFFMGASNENMDEVLKTDPSNVCGLKIFMGSSTGNMLVDNEQVLENLFSNAPLLIATHCEDEATIRANTQAAIDKYGDDIPFEMHPIIRSAEACYKSSSLAIEIAKKHNTRLHILHISTGKETELFRNDIPIEEKRITSEACTHHLWFSSDDYPKKGAFIKWNPAVKTAQDRNKIWDAVIDGRIDVLATDHAPHTFEEKSNKYLKAPSGGPLIQHAMIALLDFYHQGKIGLEFIAEKTAHAVARCFQIEKRGYIREGYFADLAIVNTQKPFKVEKSNILAKCGWSPFEGHEFRSTVEHTFISGHLAYSKGVFDESVKGQRLTFNR